jgi:hypothetical protein
MWGVCARATSAFIERNDPDSAFPLYIGRICTDFFRLRRKHTDRSRRCTYKQSMDTSGLNVTPVDVLVTFVPPMGAIRCLLLACGMRCGRLCLYSRFLAHRHFVALSWCYYA